MTTVSPTTVEARAPSRPLLVAGSRECANEHPPPDLWRHGQTIFYSFWATGLWTDPKRSGAVLTCFWNDF